MDNNYVKKLLRYSAIHILFNSSVIWWSVHLHGYIDHCTWLLLFVQTYFYDSLFLRNITYINRYVCWIILVRPHILHESFVQNKKQFDDGSFGILFIMFQCLTIWVQITIMFISTKFNYIYKTLLHLFIFKSTGINGSNVTSEIIFFNFNTVE